MSNAVLTKAEFERKLYDNIEKETIRVKALKSILDHKYYLENKDALLRYQKRYNVVNKERINILNKEHYWKRKNTETETERKVRIEKIKKWNEENKDKLELYQKRRKEKLRLELERKQKKRLHDKKYRESHREILRLRDKKYREKNREEINKRRIERYYLNRRMKGLLCH